MTYPFMPDFHAAIFVVAGGTLRQGFLWPGFAMAASLWALLFYFALRVSHSTLGALFAVLLTLGAGGLGGPRWIAARGWGEAMQSDVVQHDHTGEESRLGGARLGRSAAQEEAVLAASLTSTHPPSSPFRRVEAPLVCVCATHPPAAARRQLCVPAHCLCAAARVGRHGAAALLAPTPAAPAPRAPARDGVVGPRVHPAQCCSARGSAAARASARIHRRRRDHRDRCVGRRAQVGCGAAPAHWLGAGGRHRTAHGCAADGALPAHRHRGLLRGLHDVRVRGGRGITVWRGLYAALRASSPCATPPPPPFQVALYERPVPRLWHAAQCRRLYALLVALTGAHRPACAPRRLFRHR